MYDSEPQLHISRRHRFVAWIKRHRIWSLVIAGLILIGSASGVVAYLLLHGTPKKVESVTVKKIEQPKPAPVYYSLMTGAKVSSIADQTAPVTGVMIENSPDARPQSGLKQADVVYEAIAEGGITRFMALYQQGAPGTIGPVRSVRLYDLDWLAPYQGSLAHVGGSAEALQTIRSGSPWRDLDQFFNSGSYSRVSDRYAPHNVYTSMDRLHALETAKGFTSSTFTSFPRVDGTPTDKPSVSSVAINFSSALYNTTYTYSQGCNCYPRSQAGEPHLDREDGQIQPNVVVALHVDEVTIMQDGSRQKITTVGGGKADVFQNGTVIEGTWKKDSQASPLELLDAAGKPISLARGQTWIAAVPNSGGSISWQ